MRYGDLCRLCATKTNMVLAINIFENEGTMREINKKIESCLPIRVHESDELPKMICESCLYKLELFFDFRERSVRTESILITLLKEISSTKLNQQEINVPHLEPTGMIMIQHQPLLAAHEMPNEIDLAQLQQRDLIVQHEIILSQQNVDMTHPLANIHLTGQETMLVNDGYHGENLLVQQEHLLTDQYRLHVNIAEEQSIVNELPQIDETEEEGEEKKAIVSFNDEEDEMKQASCENSNGSALSTTNSGEPGEWLHCNMCGRSFNEKIEFQMHYEQHFNKCAICLAVFTNRDALNEHRKEMHGSSVEEIKPIKTRLKRATVPIKKEHDGVKLEGDSDSEDAAAENVDDEEDEDDPEADVSVSPTLRRKKWTPKECKECGKTYKTNYKLAEHMRKHTGEKPYQCISCEKAFRSKIGLAQHAAKHTGQYDLSCPTCGKGFQCKSYLMVHQRVHSDIKPYPCTTCGRNFKTKQSLLDHTNRHLGVKPYMCDICGRGFITKGLCKAHQKVHTGLDNRKYSCKVCNKMFVSKSYLQTHLRIHTGEKPFMCEVCGKGFLTRVDLRIHSTMHTGEKSYVCEMCGKAFARRDALRCHRRSHTGERPYSCDQCGQTFTQFSPMAIHKRLHTGERPYSCEVCSKTFVSRSTMMSHWKKHVR